MKALLLIGLPGSGKSHLANERYRGWEWVIIDDPTDKALIKRCRDFNLCICDPHLCDEGKRNKCIQYLEQLGYCIECKYFENDEEKCRKNIEFRNDGRSIGNFRSFNYSIPEGAKTIRIWTKEESI